MAKNQNLQNPLYKLPTKPPNLSGVMWGAVLLGLVLIVVVSSIATQYLAWRLAFQPALGAPVAHLGSFPIYQPFGWVEWGWKYGTVEDAYLKSVLSHVYYFVTGSVLIGVLVAGYINYRRTKNLGGGNEHLHGSAHWASQDELKATGLLGTGKGVYVGAWKAPNGDINYLRHDGPEHVMAFAPTRSGKGVGLVLPTLLSWPASVLVYDIKGENWALTAGFRKSIGQTCLKLEPTATDGSSVKFNPLQEIRLGTDKEVSDVQNIVTMIVDPDGKGLNDHWAKTGHALLVGAVLHVLYAEPDKTLAGVANFLSDPSRSIDETLNYMLNTEHDPALARGWRDPTGKATGAHPVVTASARDMLNKSENEMSGVLSTAMSFLTLYRDPVVARNTAYSEFRVRDLMNADNPVSLYLVVPPSDKDRLKPLVRLVINQIVRSLTESMEFKDGRSVAGYKHRLLLLIDEFPSLGKLDIFEEALAFIAGYGMKAYLIVQDYEQLCSDKAYGRNETIFSNCHVRIAYAPNKIQTAELLSKMTGTTTIIKAQNSYSGDRLTPMLSNVSTSVQEVQRALLTPDEVMRLPAAKKDAGGNVLEAGDMLIFVAGHAPIYGKQILYFQDPTFSQRAKLTAPTASDQLHVAPAVVTQTQPATPAAPASAPASTPAAQPQAAPKLDAPGVVPETPSAPVVPAVAASYAAAEAVPAALEPAPAELSDPGVDVIEYAPAELSEPAPAAADQDDDAPPLEAFDSMPPADDQAEAEPADVATNVATAAAGPVTNAEESSSAGTASGDDLLADLKALSANIEDDDDVFSMFDDVLNVAPAGDDQAEAAEKPVAKASGSGGRAKKAAPADDLYAGMADVLDEVAQSHPSIDR